MNKYSQKLINSKGGALAMFSASISKKKILINLL